MTRKSSNTGMSKFQLVEGLLNKALGRVLAAQTTAGVRKQHAKARAAAETVQAFGANQGGTLKVTPVAGSASSGFGTNADGGIFQYGLALNAEAFAKEANRMREEKNRPAGQILPPMYGYGDMDLDPNRRHADE